MLFLFYPCSLYTSDTYIIHVGYKRQILVTRYLPKNVHQPLLCGYYIRYVCTDKALFFSFYPGRNAMLSILHSDKFQSAVSNENIFNLSFHTDGQILEYLMNNHGKFVGFLGPNFYMRNRII